MSVTVRYLGPIRAAVGKDQENIRIETGARQAPGTSGGSRGNTLYLERGALTVGDLLEHLGVRYGLDFTYHTRAADGSLPTHALIVVDGVNLGHGRVFDTTLEGNSRTEIIVVPAVGGGRYRSRPRGRSGAAPDGPRNELDPGASRAKALP